MGPVQAIKTCFAKFFQFSGRAGRAEFWWFVLFQIALIAFALFVVDVAILGVDLMEDFAITPATELAILVVLIPGIAVTMRRLHDCGWHAQIVPIVMLGGYLTASAITYMQAPAPKWLQRADTFLLFVNIVILIAAIFPGKPGSNIYGPNPNEVPT